MTFEIVQIELQSSPGNISRLCRVSLCKWDNNVINKALNNKMFILRKNIYNRERIRIDNFWKIVSIDFIDLMACFILSVSYLSMEARIQSKNYAKESMTRHLFKIKPSFGALLSADKLRVHLLADRVELSDRRWTSEGSIANFGIEIKTRILTHKTQLEYNNVLCEQYPKLMSMVLD
jgi:hypothetical protein